MTPTMRAVSPAGAPDSSHVVAASHVAERQSIGAPSSVRSAAVHPADATGPIATGRMERRVNARTTARVVDPVAQISARCCAEGRSMGEVARGRAWRGGRGGAGKIARTSLSWRTAPSPRAAGARCPWRTPERRPLAPRRRRSTHPAGLPPPPPPPPRRRAGAARARRRRGGARRAAPVARAQGTGRLAGAAEGARAPAGE